MLRLGVFQVLTWHSQSQWVGGGCLVGTPAVFDKLRLTTAFYLLGHIVLPERMLQTASVCYALSDIKSARDNSKTSTPFKSQTTA